MTERERLIELLKEHCVLRQDVLDCTNGKIEDCPECLADHLLANEVGFVPIGRNLTEKHPVDEFVCSECDFWCEGWTEVVYDSNGEYTYQRECEFDYCPRCGSKINDFWKKEE